jgi:hypothetical protein
MKRNGFTRASLALSLAAAIGLGYTAYLQYQLSQVNAVIAQTLNGAQKVAKEASKLKIEGRENFAFNKVSNLEEKGWKLSDNNQSYELKEDGAVQATMSLDKKEHKVVYKINCGNFKGDAAKDECSKALDGTGRNYVANDEVPWEWF